MWWLWSQCCGCLGRDKEVPYLPEEGSGGGPDYGWAVRKNERNRMEDAIGVKENGKGLILVPLGEERMR